MEHLNTAGVAGGAAGEEKEFNLYRDIKFRTDGEIYLGVVGPVRTGKSTFIKRFMDLLVIPYMENEHERLRAQDEMPQSGTGRTITTTEPKFIPKEAADIRLQDGIHMKVRLVDCVGFMIPGAAGALEEDVERMVKTPWFEEEIPFTQAAEIGTEKVIKDHSTIGIAVFSDGSFGEFARNDYREAEERTVQELRQMGKPFLIILNSAKPYSEETRQTAAELEEKYHVAVLPVNCEQMKQTDVQNILQEALYEFPVSQVEFYMPKWVEMLPADHEMKQALIETVRELMKSVSTMHQFMKQGLTMDCPYINEAKLEQISLSDGTIRIVLEVEEHYYYELLSQMMGQNVENEYQLMQILREFAAMKQEYVKVEEALDQVRRKGYGVVAPEKGEISLEEPEIIRHGNKYGVKIKAESPSIHMIRANIETEIAPIVGTEEQAKDLIEYIKDADQGDEGIWETNIFGKTVEQLVQDGIHGKIGMMGDECQLKLQETMQKIVNESNGKMICIII
ncbi:MAG: stage IV sporulation protein A [Lachnospiraceae bacterium]|jgi:stage IV sporulation protein A|nr:stage IV sporulation protein A [Lachnospiraceae bacterium]